ncbi:unnamed protein product [Amoebophrya sp. A120]|nr:unnamed protein product [Amoebophrya sp. A120]|eukprot:GSA120T00021301001.1
MSCGNDNPNLETREQDEEQEEEFCSTNYHWGHPLAEEVYLSLRTIQDPEKPYTLEELEVVYPEGIVVTDSEGKLCKTQLKKTTAQNGNSCSSNNGSGCCGGDHQAGAAGTTAASKTSCCNSSEQERISTGGQQQDERSLQDSSGTYYSITNFGDLDTKMDVDEDRTTVANFVSPQDSPHPPSSSLQAKYINVTFKPTSPVCSLATLIGLAIMHKLREDIPTDSGFPKFSIQILEGSHNSGDAVTKQLNDKERRYAAMENPDIAHAVRTACRLEGDYD